MPRSFKTEKEFRAWLGKNHATETELIIRLFKVHARDRGIGYREALDEALCYGWIDGVRKALDEDSFTQRFTPRKPKSNWSRVNIRRVEELQKEGRMRPPGLKAFEARDATAIAPYSFEAGAITLTPALERRFRANRKAWSFFQAQPPYAKRVSIFYVMTAKKDETRERRLDHLIERCAQGKRVGVLEKSP